VSAVPTVVVEFSRAEAAHLAALVSQFLELVDDPASRGFAKPEDPAVARLVPDAYADDAEASGEFRRFTADDLLTRRADDARALLGSLAVDGSLPSVTDLTDADAVTALTVILGPDLQAPWLRTLTAVRLVLASRLGIEDEHDHDDEDPRFAVYDWLGYRLDALVRAIDGDL
jgi:hypothetical protein